jgi:hypothetical protein
MLYVCLCMSGVCVRICVSLSNMPQKSSIHTSIDRIDPNNFRFIFIVYPSQWLLWHGRITGRTHDLTWLDQGADYFYVNVPGGVLQWGLSLMPRSVQDRIFRDKYIEFDP